MPVAKIVILNWNGAEHLRRFLPSVVAAAPAGVEGMVAHPCDYYEITVDLAVD